MMGEAPPVTLLLCAIVFTAAGFVCGFWAAADASRELIAKCVETTIQTIHGEGTQ